MVTGDTAATDMLVDPPRPSVQGIRALADLCQHAGVHELEASMGTWSVHLRIDIDAASSLPEATWRRPEANEPRMPHVLRSEWVGVFHRGLDGESTPLVQDGQQVRDGDVVGLIEAMQLLHEQHADLDGTILRFLIDDGAPVEYGQPLLEIG